MANNNKGNNHLASIGQARDMLTDAADARGHGAASRGAAVGAGFGALVGSFAGPWGAAGGAAVGGWLGYQIADDSDDD